MIKHTVVGRVTSVQESRLRVVTDDGRGFLLTLGRDAHFSNFDLQDLEKSRRRVRIRYKGEANIASGLVCGIETLDGQESRSA
jgi:hypothetical protein